MAIIIPGELVNHKRCGYCNLNQSGSAKQCQCDDSDRKATQESVLESLRDKDDYYRKKNKDSGKGRGKDK